jgi:hypothetical protein
LVLHFYMELRPLALQWQVDRNAPAVDGNGFGAVGGSGSGRHGADILWVHARRYFGLCGFESGI